MRAKFGLVPTAISKIWSFKFISRCSEIPMQVSSDLIIFSCILAKNYIEPISNITFLLLEVEPVFDHKSMLPSWMSSNSRSHIATATELCKEMCIDMYEAVQWS